MNDEFDIDLLDTYLWQYHVAKREMDRLEGKLKEIRMNIENPLSGVRYGQNLHPENEISLGAATYPLQEDEALHRINDQRLTLMKDLDDILAVINLLDRNSEEREALHLYYIEGYTWERVARAMYMSVSTVYERRKSGLTELLEFPQVQSVLRDFRSQQEEKQFLKDDTPD